MAKELSVRTGAVWFGDCPADWVESTRKIYDYELVFFSKGRCRVLTENRTYWCGENTVIIIPPGLEHCSVADTLCTRWCIHFDWYGDCQAYADGRRVYVYANEKDSFDPALSARKLEGALDFPLCFKLTPEHAERIKDCLQSFFREIPSTLGKSLMRNGWFLEILGSVVEASGNTTEASAKNPTFWHGKKILDSRFAEPDLEIRDVANELMITPNHLNKLFQQYLKQSPRMYLQQRRLVHAEKLLRRTSDSIGVIAEICGFASANYFVRCFKSRYGTTPQKFRQKFVMD